MNRTYRTMIALLALAALTAAGCAKQEVVRKDDVVAQQQTVKPQTDQQAATRLNDPAVAVAGSGGQGAAGDSAAQAATQEMQLETVYFDFDQSDLRQDSRDALSRNAALLLKRAAQKVTIEGHCDERGTDEYNLALGERRAKAVAAYLTTLGVKAERIATISYGEEKPKVQGSDEAAWSKNRRAEFVVAK